MSTDSDPDQPAELKNLTDREKAGEAQRSKPGMPDPALREAQMKMELSAIGKRQPRLDGPEKVSGRSLFTDDIKLPGMLWGKILRSRYAHAKILRIDASKALAFAYSVIGERQTER